MAVMNMIQAINSAHKVMLARDPDVVVYGEDIGYFGGVFRATEGLQREFGKTRVFDAPISENGIVATAVLVAALLGTGPNWSPATGSPWRSGVLADVAGLL